MLDRLPAWLRHAILMLIASAGTVLLPLLADHQEDVRDLVVRDLHLPLIVAPIVGTLIGLAIVGWTTLTRQYGSGATTPPTVPVIDPTTGPDVPTQPSGMAG